MSTVLSVIVVIVVLIVAGLLLYAVSRRKRSQLIAETQVQAKRDDLSHHRNQAREARAEAEIAERAKRAAAAEADLNEHKAAQRERELKSSD